MTTLAETFLSLFAGRVDAYGADHGEAVRFDGDWNELIRGHLDGTCPIGVYPLTGLGVRWGMVDFDYTDDITDARNVAEVLSHFGISAWVEISKSKGFHTWTFANEFMDATTMRNALLAAVQIVGLPTTLEVNPKQTEFNADKLGNYARLPYPGAADTGLTADGRRQFIDGGGFGYHLKIVTAAYLQRADKEQYEPLAALYVPPAPKRTVQIIPPAGGMHGGLTDKLSGIAWTIWQNGPTSGSDRSSTLYRFVHKARESGLTPGEARLLLGDCDLRWGKFQAQGRDEMLDRIVESCYG